MVFININMRPDWEIMNKRAIILSADKPEYEVPYDTIEREHFIYMGILPGSEVPVNSSITYKFEIYYILCQNWKSQWINHYCLVGNDTSEQLVHCQCNHFSIFSSAIAIPPNDLNPLSDAKLFLTVLDNPWVVVFVAVLLLGFLLALLWAAFRDRKDKIIRDVIVLDDNFPGEQYGYLVAVHTGARFTSGTTANVGIRLYGETFSSRAHILKCRRRKVLQRDYDDWFLIFYPTTLGVINFVQLWHDNSGRHPDWFCSKIVVYDLIDQMQYIFFVEQWLALEVNEFPEAVVQPATVDEVLSVKRIFLDNSVFGFRENHTWLSVVVRHPRSSVSRKERLTVLMVCIISSMFASIMFFKTSDKYSTDVDEPTYSVGTREIIVSVQSFMVSTIITITVLCLFRQSIRQKPVKEKSTLFTPSRRSVSDISEFWQTQQPSHITLSDMKAYSDKPERERKDMTMYESIVRTIRRFAVPKKLRPVQLANQPPTIYVNRVLQTIAWVISIAVILICSYMVMLYSLKFGKVKSQKWLSSLLMTMGEDVFIFTPLKIICFAVILSVVFERVVDVSSFNINIKNAIKLHLVGDKEYLSDLCETRELPMYCPISREVKENLRERRICIMKWRTMLDFVLVFIFIMVLCLVMLNMWSGAHFPPNHHVKELLSLAHEDGAVSFHDIFNRSQFIQYLDSTFVSAVYIFRWYNSVDMPKLTPLGEQYRRKDWAADFTLRLMGIPRLRQLRVKPGKCHLNNMFNLSQIMCTLPWSTSNMDTDIYGISWRGAHWEQYLDYLSSWKFTESWNSSVFSLPGKTGIDYPPGGYIVDLGVSRSASLRILHDLRETYWQDERTRVTFVELTLYNVNNNLFSQVTMVAELMPYGMILAISYIESVHIKEEISIWNMTYLIFIFIMFIRILYKINRNGFLNFLKKFLNIYELFVILLGILSVVIYVIHLKGSSHYVEQYQKEGLDTFFNFKELIYYFSKTKIFLWLLFCFSIFRLFVTWHFGRIYVTYYYTFILSRPWIILLLFLLSFYFFIVWRFIGYVVGAFVFSNYKTMIIHDKSYHSLESEANPTRNKTVLLFMCLLTICFKLFYFLIFTYYYKIARNYKQKSEHQFNFITFIFEEIQRLFKKKNKKKVEKIKEG